MKVIVMGVHPDDPETDCGGTIAKFDCPAGAPAGK